MAYTTAELNTIIATLERSLTSGAAVVQFEGRRVEYRSGTEIMAAISYFKGLLGSATDSVAPRIRQTRMYSDKGF